MSKQDAGRRDKENMEVLDEEEKQICGKKEIA